MFSQAYSEVANKAGEGEGGGVHDDGMSKVLVQIFFSWFQKVDSS